MLFICQRSRLTANLVIFSNICNTHMWFLIFRSVYSRHWFLLSSQQKSRTLLLLSVNNDRHSVLVCHIISLLLIIMIISITYILSSEEPWQPLILNMRCHHVTDKWSKSTTAKSSTPNWFCLTSVHLCTSHKNIYYTDRYIYNDNNNNGDDNFSRWYVHGCVVFLIQR